MLARPLLDPADEERGSRPLHSTTVDSERESKTATRLDAAEFIRRVSQSSDVARA